MRQIFVTTLLLINTVLQAAAQDAASPSPSVNEQQDLTSDDKTRELKARIEAGRKKQEAANAKTTGLWTRWTYAVCIGCGVGEPKNMHVVHTTPARVLAGIPAAEDDARELAMARRGRHL